MKTLTKKGGKLEEYIKIRNSKGLGNTLFSSIDLANEAGGPGCFPLLSCTNSSNSFANKELCKI